MPSLGHGFELKDGGHPPVITPSLEEWGGISPSAVAERSVHIGVNIDRCQLLKVVIEPHDSLLWVGSRMIVRD